MCSLISGAVFLRQFRPKIAAASTLYSGGAEREKERKKPPGGPLILGLFSARGKASACCARGIKFRLANEVRILNQEAGEHAPTW